MKQQLKAIQEKFFDAADALEEARELVNDFQEKHTEALNKDSILADITDSLYEIADQGFNKIDMQYEEATGRIDVALKHDSYYLEFGKVAK